MLPKAGWRTDQETTGDGSGQNEQMEGRKQSRKIRQTTPLENGQYGRDIVKKSKR